MKRFLSVLLCCVMMISVFSTAFMVSAASANDYLKVSTTGISNGSITYTISLLPGQSKMNGSIIQVAFDSSALRVASCGAAGGSSPNVSGLYEVGQVYNDPNRYAMAYVSTSGVNINAEKEFFTITFEVIAEDGSMADVDFRCIEHVTDDGNNDNDIKRTENGVSFYSDSFLTLDTPVISKVYSVDKSLVVEWNAVPGAAEYNVYRREAGASEWTEVATVSSSETSYTDNGIETGVEYEYIVTASNENGETSRNTSATPGFNFGAIEEMGTESLTDGIEVTWGALKSAECYEVYRKEATQSASGWTKIATVPSSNISYKDTTATSGVTYNYKIEAVKGTYRAGTNAAAIPEGKYIKTATPAVKKVSSNAGVLVAEWDAVENAVSYNVYRKTAGSAWEYKDNVTTTNFVDRTITSGTEYFYTVSAVNALGSETAYNGTGVAGLYFGTITSINAVAAPKGAKITWGALQYAEKYEVYRKKATESESAWVKVATTTSTYYTDEAIESFVDYNYKVEAIKGVYRAGMSADIPTVKYLAMPEFAVTSTENGIELYYGQVNGATEYVIEKKTGNGSWTQLLVVENPDEGVYLDENVVVKGSYSYRIKAYSSDPQITSETLTLAAITRLETPKLTGLSVGINGMSVTWNAVSGATKYNIYRKEITESEYAVIGTATGTSYVDKTAKSGVVYTYTVSAANATGCGAYTKSGVTRLFLATPKLLSRENIVNGVKVTWSAVDGATGYRVYRRGAGEKNWTYLGTFSASKTYYNDYGKDSTGKKIGMVNGNYYRYTVRATNENRGANIYPNGYNQTVYSSFEDGIYLKYVATPKISSLSNTTKGVLIKWNAIKGATKYRVYRRGSGATTWYFLGETSSTSYTDIGIVNASGKYYRYTVRAVSGYYSGFEANGPYLMRLADPVLISARSSKAGITVKWRSVPGTASYNVYRKTSSTTWQRIAVVKGTNSSQYVDKTAKKGVTYTYTVRACYGSYISSYNSKGLTCKDLY